MNKQIDTVLALVIPQFKLDINHGLHGISHWSRVWRNAKELCSAMDVDPLVPCLFSFFHDSQRKDENADIEHGARACEWIGELFVTRKLQVSHDNFRLLVEAIAGHSFGEIIANPIVQICWDSDRLDLGRVGIRPDPRYLCTEHARKPETIEASWKRSIGEKSS